MVSNLSLYTELTEETIGYILERVDKPRAGSLIKVYIPKIMQNIQRGSKPQIKICGTQYNGGIINASDCKPKISSLLKEQNYLTGILESNSSISSISTRKTEEYIALNQEKHYIENVLGNPKLTAAQLGRALDKAMKNGTREVRILKEEIPAGRTVRVTFYNGKLNQVRINTNDDMKADPDKQERWDKKYNGPKGKYTS